MDEPKTPGKVTQINEARKKKIKADKDVKLKIAEIYRSISDAIKRAPYATLPQFPYRYEVIEPERGARVPILVSDDESVVVMRPEALANDILSYSETELGARQEFAIEPRQAKSAADYYTMTARPVPLKEIAIARWQGEPGLTYRRLPWRRERGDAPTWQELLGRMSNAQAFVHWIGSLFAAESYLQNYVWLYGRLGGDGKGAINRFLERVFGRSYRTKQSPGHGNHRDKFWTYGLLGARLVVFPDCDDPVFVTKGLFKSLTGGDPTDVEAKGAMSFTTKLNAKFLVISNEWPSLSLSPSDMRRIIFCELGASSGVDPQFEDRLWAEGGAFLSACIDHYEAAYPNHGLIKSEGEVIEGLAATLEEDFDEVFKAWFIPTPGSWVVAEMMLNLVCAEWPRDRKQQDSFRRWLEKRHGIRKSRLRTDEGREWGYIGVELLKIPPERRINPAVQGQLNKGHMEKMDSTW